MERKKIFSPFSYKTEELKEMAEQFLSELNLAETPEQLCELLKESSDFDKKWNEETREGKERNIEKATWEKTTEVLGMSWEGWRKLLELFSFYTPYSALGGVKDWEVAIIAHMDGIAKTDEEKDFMKQKMKFKLNTQRATYQRIHNPTPEQLYEEFVSQSTL